MAKKRKLRPSEPESSNENPESELQQQIEEQEPQDIEEQEQEEQQEMEEQQQIEEQEQQEIEEQELEQQANEEAHPMDDDEDDNEEETEEGGGDDAVNSWNDTQEAPSETNGGEKAGDGEEEEEIDGDEEPVEKLLEPFGKEQLVVLLKEAAARYPEFMENIQKLADADPAHRKIFVHGLGWDTNAETLTSVFGKYGEIEDCKAVCDKVSGKSKGYGFILFKHRSGARKALKQPQKKIGTRMTSCQLAYAGPVPAPPPTAPPVSEYTQRKIFVSNVSADIDPQKLLEYFSKYGEIEDGPLGLDKQTGKPKGFALFVYKTVDSAKKALDEPHKIFEGHTLHCQKAIDGPKPNKPYYQPQHQHQHQHQHHQPQQFHHHSGRKEKAAKYSSGSGGPGSGHLMAPSGPAVGFNPAVAAPALAPALGQALTALLATQGAGLGIPNLLGGLGGPVNQGVPPMMNNTGYGNQGGGGYGNQPVMQGGYQNPQMGQMGQGNAGRSHQGGAPYMGHGH